jgi:hypothetical protein
MRHACLPEPLDQVVGPSTATALIVVLVGRTVLARI